MENLSDSLEELLKESGLTLARFEHIGSLDDKKPPYYFLSLIEKQ